MRELAQVGARDLGLAGGPVIDVFVRRKHVAPNILAKAVPGKALLAIILQSLKVPNLWIKVNRWIRYKRSET